MDCTCEPVSSMSLFGKGGVFDAKIASTDAGSERINDKSRHLLKWHLETINHCMASAWRTRIQLPEGCGTGAAGRERDALKGKCQLVFTIRSNTTKPRSCHA